MHPHQKTLPLCQQKEKQRKMKIEVEIGMLKALKKPKERYSEADAWVDLMVMQAEGEKPSQNALVQRWGWHYTTVARFLEAQRKRKESAKQNGGITDSYETAAQTERANNANCKESTPYNPLKENNPSPTTTGGRARDERIFTVELMRQEHWLGWAMARLNMTGYKFQRAMREYAADCNARGKISKDLEDAKAHFINWVEKKRQYDQYDNGREKHTSTAANRAQEQLQWAREFAQYNALKYGTDACGANSTETL